MATAATDKLWLTTLRFIAPLPIWMDINNAKEAYYLESTPGQAFIYFREPQAVSKLTRALGMLSRVRVRLSVTWPLASASATESSILFQK